MNLIITSPHDGHQNPSKQENGDPWLNRKDGCIGQGGKCIWTHNCGGTSYKCFAQNLDDFRTAPIARDIVAGIKVITGKGHI